MNTLKDFAARIFGQVEKRQGLYVSRPVLNGQAWVDWAAAAGIPNIVPADQMHVTIIASRVNQQIIPLTSLCPIYVEAGRTTFGFMGPAGTVLAVNFMSWCLTDRVWDLQSLGLTSDWPEYRPHMTLSYDCPADFEIPVESLTTTPPAIMLGGEAFADFAPAAEKSALGAPPADIVTPTAEEAQLAAALFVKAAESSELDIFSIMALRDVSARRPVEKTTMEMIREAIGEPDHQEKTSAEVVLVEKSSCRQIVYGWANVTIEKGEEVVDSQNDHMTIDAQHDFVHGLISGTRNVNLNHEKSATGDYTSIGEVVEGIVLDKVIQDALVTKCSHCGEHGPVDLEKEGSLLGMHIADKSLYDQTGPGKKYAQLSIGALPETE